MSDFSRRVHAVSGEIVDFIEGLQDVPTEIKAAACSVAGKVYFESKDRQDMDTLLEEERRRNLGGI